MIEYQYTEGKPNADVKVRLDGKVIGEIRREVFPLPNGGWRYFPKGWKVGGELFSSLGKCQKSLSSE